MDNSIQTIVDQTRQSLDAFNEFVLKDEEKPKADRIFKGKSSKPIYQQAYVSKDLPGILRALYDNPHPEAIKLSTLLTEKLSTGNQVQAPSPVDEVKDDTVQPQEPASNIQFIYKAGELYEVPIDMVQDSPELQIFSSDPQVEDKLCEKMKKEDFDKGSPNRVYWDGTALKTLDGHTRLRAARKAGLTKIWVIIEDVKTPDDAMIRAVQAQTLRRNMTPADIFAAIRVLAPIEAEKAKERQGRAGENMTANESIAEQLGISPTTVARVKKIIEHRRFVKRVYYEKMSIRSAFETIMELENDKAAKEGAVRTKDAGTGVRRTAKNATLSIEAMEMLLCITSAEDIPVLEKIKDEYATGYMKYMLGQKILALRKDGEAS